ncbi:FMN-binding negative transcriptional regulator [Bernardetia sp. OM2101]|uniref:FMN-binding negative transcriptional regulator n=1 Tax=Bernardetia sp. OM2101 TaxID=3344876 RepID=UPI0035D0AC45
MWIPEKYKIEDQKIIKEFIDCVGLAALVTMSSDFPVATHTPIELEYDENGKQILRGHIAKANPQSKILETQPNVLVIFQSSIQHYISSFWYEKPNAPTWNYMAVHIYGKVRILNEEEVHNSVNRLTKRHEKISKCPVSLESLPNTIQGMLKGVTGFEIPVNRVEAAFKLSQNKNEKDLTSIIEELEILNTPLSKIMSQTLKKYKL